MRYQTFLCSVILCAVSVFAQSQPHRARVAAPQPSYNIWGVNAQMNIFQGNGTQWTQVSNGQAAQVSVGADGTVWAASSAGNLSTWNGSSWQAMPGSLTQISVAGENNVWGVNYLGYVFHWDGTDWTIMPGSAAQISAAADGTVWAVDFAGNISSWNGVAWQPLPVPGTFTQVSVGSANYIWAVNPQNNIYQWSGTTLAYIPGLFKQVSVSAGGTAYTLDPSGNLHTWNGSTWQAIPGVFSQIAAGYGLRIPNNSPSVTLQGSWSAITSANAAAGGYLESPNTGDSLSLTFTGDSVALYRLVDSNGGQATATVDGKSMGVIDFFFPPQQAGTNTQMWQVPAVLDHLGAGQHTLVLTVTGNHDTPSNTATSPPTYTSNDNNVYIDSFVAPAPFFASADQQTAVTRVNFYRNQAGLPLAALDRAVDLSAQAHAVYNSTNPGNWTSSPHSETVGAQGFVGVYFYNRMSYFGYNLFNGTNEVAAQTTAASSVDEWMNTVFHRVPIMSYLNTDVGFGLSQLNGNLNTVMDFGNLSGVAPTSTVVTTYPLNNQANVPLTWNGEGPCPVPNCTSGTQGSPITVQIAQPASATLPGILTAPSSFQLTDPSGNVVAGTPVYAGNEMGGPPERLTRSAGDVPLVLPDGRFVYYVKSRGISESSLWRVPLPTGEEVEMVPRIQRLSYAVGRRALYFSVPQTAGGGTIESLDPATGKHSILARTDKEPDSGVAVSPDSRYLLLSQDDYQGANLLMIENFY